MPSTNITLRKHLSNIIYIDNGFSLELFKPTPVSTAQFNVDSDDEIIIRKSPAVIGDTSSEQSPADVQSNMTVETFFGATQDYAPDLNILPYYYEPVKFWDNINFIKQKLSHFPLIIIDWSLEGENGKKTGIDVFDEIVKDTETLHYYVIYSNEVSKAIEMFKSKYPDVQLGSISENNVAVVKDVIIMFANKQTCNADLIIEKLATFTVENYGYLPQMFLSVKQQIENKTASLYNEFMGLDSIMLPQLIMDEAYAYEGMQEEVISSIIVNKLRSDLVIDRQDISYGYFALDKLLHTNFSEESFVKAMDGIKNPPKNMTYEICKERIQKILEQKCLNNFDFNSLKDAAQIFFTGNIEEPYDESVSEEKRNLKRKDQIWRFVLFLSICCDKNYYSKYVKLLSLIKLTEYKNDFCWTIQDCKDDSKAKALCQGDVFINETNDTFLLCITPSCQLIRPDKINSTFTFLKGYFSKKCADVRQKQVFSTHLINRDKTKVILVNWEFFSPIVIDFSKPDSHEELVNYKRCYRLNMEYTHKIVELYSEYIKQIGVEELFGKRIDGKEKNLFLETKGDDNDSN